MKGTRLDCGYHLLEAQIRFSFEIVTRSPVSSPDRCQDVFSVSMCEQGWIVISSPGCTDPVFVRSFD